MVPMKAVRKRPQCPQIFVDWGPFFLWGIICWQWPRASAWFGIGSVFVPGVDAPRPPHAATGAARAGELQNGDTSVREDTAPEINWKCWSNDPNNLRDCERSVGGSDTV